MAKLKTVEVPVDGVAASLDRVRRGSLDKLTAEQVSGLVRRIVASENNGEKSLDVAAFQSSI
jgi:hypothetical protein